MPREPDSFALGRGRSAGIGARLLGALRPDRPIDDERFERLYAEHAGPLLSLLAMRAGDRALAEDLLADTFERVLRKGRTFDRRRGSEKTWLYSVALNVLRDHLRRTDAAARATERLGFERGTSGSDPALEMVEHRDALSHALGELSDEEREAVALRYGGDLTVPEIAELTGDPLTTVEGRVYRALRKLRDRLEPSA